MASPEGRVFGRPGNRQALNRAYQYLDLVPKGRDEEGFKFPMKWVRGTTNTEAPASALLETETAS